MTLTWSDPEDRAVREDKLLEDGGSLLLVLPACYCIFDDRYGDGGHFGDGDGNDGDDYGDHHYHYGRGGYGDGGFGDGGDMGDAAGGYGHGGGDGGWGASGVGAAGYGGYDRGGAEGLIDRMVKSREMRNEEPAIVVVSSGSSPYVFTGRPVHVRGDEWELRNCRIIRRFGNEVALAWLAQNGPAPDTQLLPMSPVECIHRLHVTRVIPMTEEVFQKFCEAS